MAACFKANQQKLSWNRCGNCLIHFPVCWNLSSERYGYQDETHVNRAGESSALHPNLPIRFTLKKNNQTKTHTKQNKNHGVGGGSCSDAFTFSLNGIDTNVYGILDFSSTEWNWICSCTQVTVRWINANPQNPNPGMRLWHRGLSYHLRHPCPTLEFWLRTWLLYFHSSFLLMYSLGSSGWWPSTRVPCCSDGRPG